MVFPGKPTLPNEGRNASAIRAQETPDCRMKNHPASPADLSELGSMRRANAMECPLLGGNYIASCTALKRVYVPSSFELGEYCRTIAHRVCPFYLQAVEESRVVRAEGVPVEPVRFINRAV